MKKIIIFALALLASGCAKDYRHNVDYPYRANEFRISGEVSACYFVDHDGVVKDVKIIRSEPRHVFERDVIKSIKSWSFNEKERGKTHCLEIKFES